jgi:hypothetical protein
MVKKIMDKFITNILNSAIFILIINISFQISSSMFLALLAKMHMRLYFLSL